MRRKWLIALLSVTMLFGVVPAYGAEDSGESQSLVWEGYIPNTSGSEIFFTTSTSSESKVIFNSPTEIRTSKLVGEWVYFLLLDGTSESFAHIVKIKKDGSAFTYVSKDADYLHFQIAGDTIYFLKRKKGMDVDAPMSFGSMKMDGTDEKIIRPNSTFNVVGAPFKIYKGHVYYVDRNNGKLYRMKLDGTGTKVISSQKIDSYEIFNNMLFFEEDGPNNSKGILVDLNSQKRKTFNTINGIQPLGYDNNRLYYLTWGDTGQVIYVFDGYTGKKNKLLYLPFYDFFSGKVGKEFVFKSSSKGIVYKVGYDGTVKKINISRK
ncbi:DUF5050 domain-containing protein [Paenibacillus amylolyticus]|uniref:DUF5050 domain-containing protein n=1 Tax=Paenibacillus amylolyticus TaxID=1451 RepID=UPI003EC14592